MELKLSISLKGLNSYVTSQCNTFFPDEQPVAPDEMYLHVEDAMRRTEHCFSNVALPHYMRDGQPMFNHLNGDHYCIFLCYLARGVFVAGKNVTLATKVFLLNKALHGIDAFYEVQFPDIFIVVHPLGAVLGKAKYADRFVVYQGVTVGSTAKGIYPVFGGDNILYSNSSVIGECVVGKNVAFGARSHVIDTKIEDNKVVVGSFPDHRIMEKKKEIRKIFV